MNESQGTDQWFLDRVGHITGSKMAVIMNGGPKAWCTYLDKIVAELEDPQLAIPKELDVPALNWGKKTEPRAIAQYELDNDIDVEQVGFIKHPSINYVGCSPDFVVPAAVGEVKCPYNPEVHAMTVIHGMGTETYKPQIQTEIWCSEKDGAHFISYDPRYPDPDKRYIMIEVPRDDDYIDLMAEKCHQFWTHIVHDTRPAAVMPDEIPRLF